MSTLLELLTQLGHDGLAIKYYVVAIATILFYDYLLTLADEIEYAWCRRRSWVFWLFLVNRYFPMTYPLWLIAVSFHPNFNVKICEKTAWYHILMFVVCTLIAQIVLTIRIYAVTMKNVPIAIGFAVITASQFSFGVYILVRAVQEGAQQLPNVPLDAFHLCIFVPHMSLEVAYTSISLLYDSLAFIVIVFFATKPAAPTLKIPTILGTIAQDAMRYFLVIFTSHFVFELTLTRGRESIRLLPGPGLLVYLPVMISRLMLSLRKAADAQQLQCWSLSELSEPSALRTPFQTAKFVSIQGDSCKSEDDVPLDTGGGV